MDFPITDRETAQAVLDHLMQRAAARGLELREAPPEPTSCCGRGCNGCVWEGYFAAVAYWRDEALLMLDD
ncbi:oxidoreductase-like domain-containing protein [Roseateles sp.]|uniref:oxidoreductase-like domain-containing protein n=1 Tax=Roseateles sp. TaxID=1971397 RepID=UPI0037C5D7C3